MTHTPGPVQVLARLVIQNELYHTDPDIRWAVDDLLNKPVFDAAPELQGALDNLLEAFEEYATVAQPAVTDNIAAVVRESISTLIHSRGEE